MRAYSEYKHISCKDVSMYVLKVTYRGGSYFKAKVALVDYKTKYVYEYNIPVKIKHADLWKWEIV